jgi:hypothetical protein
VEKHSLDDIRAAMAKSPEFAELKDTSSRRQALYRLIAEHPDPLLREIGQQLRDGHLRPTEVLSTPQYREHLQAGLADGLARLTQTIGALEDHLRAEAAEQQAPDRKTKDTDPDADVMDTLGPIMRRR